MKNLGKVFKYGLLLYFCLACRKSVYFNPDFFVTDFRVGGIVSERGEVILSSEPAFNEYACMHINKVKELRRLLYSVKLTPNQIQKVNNQYLWVKNGREKFYSDKSARPLWDSESEIQNDRGDE